MKVQNVFTAFGCSCFVLELCQGGVVEPSRATSNNFVCHAFLCEPRLFQHSSTHALVAAPVPPSNATATLRAMTGSSLSSDETRLARGWYAQDGLRPAKIAQRLGRDKSTISRLLKRGGSYAQRGRKAAISPLKAGKLVTKVKELVNKADGQGEVTIAMLKRSSRCSASTKTIAKALHDNGVFFRRLTQKPTLTEQDIKDRATFARKFKDKSCAWWRKHIQLHIDVKHFSIFLDCKGRRHVAQVGCRGAYRALGEKFSPGTVKPNVNMKYNSGVRGVKVLAGVGNGGSFCGTSLSLDGTARLPPIPTRAPCWTL